MAPAVPRIAADDVAGSAMRHWKLVALIAAAVMFLAWLAAAVQPKRYRAVSIAAVSPLSGKLSPSDMVRGIDTLDRRVVVASLAALASAPVTQSTAVPQGDYEIASVVLPNTNLFRIEVEGTQPARTADIANSIPAILDRQAQAIYKLYGVTLVSPATAPKSPFLPRMGRAAAAGLILGLLLGIAAAWLLDRRRAA